jgi:hypothetical protein
MEPTKKCLQIVGTLTQNNVNMNVYMVRIALHDI